MKYSVTLNTVYNPGKSHYLYLNFTLEGSEVLEVPQDATFTNCCLLITNVTKRNWTAS